MHENIEVLLSQDDKDDLVIIKLKKILSPESLYVFSNTKSDSIEEAVYAAILNESAIDILKSKILTPERYKGIRVEDRADFSIDEKHALLDIEEEFYMVHTRLEGIRKRVLEARENFRKEWVKNAYMES